MKQSQGSSAVLKQSQGSSTVLKQSQGSIAVLKQSQGSSTVLKQSQGSIAVLKQSQGSSTVLKQSQGSSALLDTASSVKFKLDTFQNKEWNEGDRSVPLLRVLMQLLPFEIRRTLLPSDRWRDMSITMKTVVAIRVYEISEVSKVKENVTGDSSDISDELLKILVV